MANLYLRNNDSDELVATFDGSEPITIGRASDCNVKVSGTAVSGHHLQISGKTGNWTATDLDSSNGTTLNGNDLAPSTPVRLENNSKIVLGSEVTLYFEDDAIAASATASESAKTSSGDLELVKSMSRLSDRIRAEIAKVIVGQVDVIDQVLMVIIAGGHGLLVGMPGMAKTTLCSTIAKVLDMEFKRVQFTPDLMPTDITGSEILEHDPETDKKTFRFIRGPIFTNMLLADEINRTPPKTQASLLEAMQEKCVTVGNQTYQLEPPFFVLATQNPVEQEGTYPLPEAQQDRFMFNLWVDYPKEDEEETVVKATTVGKRSNPEKVLSKEQLLQLQQVVRKIPVSDHVIKYAVRLVRATRPQDEKAPEFIRKYVQNGAGPRAGQYLVLAAKARAVLEGRIHVSCNDVIKAAVPVLRHRIQSNFAADSEGITTMDLVNRLVKEVEQPGENDYPEKA